MTAMKVVPVTLTDEMLDAAIAWRQGFEVSDKEPSMRDQFVSAYKAMLSAVEPAPDGLVERLRELMKKATPMPWDLFGDGGIRKPGGLFSDKPAETGQFVCRPDEWEDAELIVFLANHAEKIIAAALTSRAAVLEEKNDWIAVSERLPDVYVPVVVLAKPYANKGDCAAFAVYTGRKWEMADVSFDWLMLTDDGNDGGTEKAQGVHHWMPIPAIRAAKGE